MVDDARKYAYRKLLYHAMVDTRNRCSTSTYNSLNPRVWYKQYHNSIFAYLIADWLHNLANYSASDFKEFNEDWFWEEFSRIVVKFPEIKHYYDSFEGYELNYRNGLTDQ